MIAKIGKGANLTGALTYNHSKVENENGKILFTNNMLETPNGIYSVSQLRRSFELYLLANQNTEIPVLHISINPDPKEQVSDEKFQDIARDYMSKMGYGNQPYVVFKHTDIDRTHIHIVSVNVDEHGKKISDSFEKRRSMEICRELELKYDLMPTSKKQDQDSSLIFRPVDYKAGNIKSQIASVVRYLPKYYQFQNLGTYNALLSLYNITSEEVTGELHGVSRHGLVYFALDEHGQKIGSPLKASLFGKNAGFMFLQEHFERCKESLKNNPAKASIKSKIEMAIKASSNEGSFKKQLLKQGINTVVRRNSDGRIYGITFIDHNSKTVWNGSQLSRENLSAKVFNDWWNKGIKPGTGHNTGKSELPPNEPHALFDLFSERSVSDGSGLFESLGSLFPESHGDDYEELNFENRMKKKKKRNQRKQ